MKALALALSALLAASPALASGHAFDAAAAAELSRAKDLKEPGYQPPYYVSLTGIDVDSWERRCLFGAESFAGHFRQRLLTPDVRVGSYAMDNRASGAVSDFKGVFVASQDDEFSLRHSIWQALDSSYKDASADFLRKEAQRETQGKADYDTDDLTREEPRVAVGAKPADDWDRAQLSRDCRQASAVFRRAPWLLDGEASVRARRQWSRLLDTEGSRVDFPRDTVELELEAQAVASDGMKLDSMRRFTASSPEGLPSAAKLQAEAADMIKTLERLKSASTTSPFSAPALLDPSVSAAVVLSIGQRLSGEEQRNPSGAQTFKGKLGKPVMDRHFTLVDDPTLSVWDKTPLLGHYDFDDQGVAPSRVTLIDHGVLKGLLLSRYPVVGFDHSNGHGRASFAGYMPQGSPGVLMLSSSAPIEQERLLKILRRECRRRGKPYGIWIKRLRTFAQQEGTADETSIRLMPELVYLVDAKTGKLTLVRNLDVVGTPLEMLSNILYAGQDEQVRNGVHGVPVSVVTPSLLLGEVELQRSETKPEKQPILPPPQP